MRKLWIFSWEKSWKWKEKPFVKEKVEIYTTFPLSHQKHFQASAEIWNKKSEHGKEFALFGSLCQKENWMISKIKTFFIRMCFPIILLLIFFSPFLRGKASKIIPRKNIENLFFTPHGLLCGWLGDLSKEFHFWFHMVAALQEIVTFFTLKILNFDFVKHLYMWRGLTPLL
jgi:hypothetical protein